MTDFIPGLGGGGSSAPPAIDARKLSEQQFKTNRKAALETQRLNRQEQVTPFGSVTFEKTGNRFAPTRQIISLDPVEQQILDAQRALGLNLTETAGTQGGIVADALSQPFSLEGLPPAPVANADVLRSVEDALFTRQSNIFEPRFQQEREDLEARLLARGIPLDSAVAFRELDNLSRQQELVRENARLTSISGAGAEQSRLFGLEDRARGRGVSEAQLLREQPLQELNALLTFGQINAPQPAPQPAVSVAQPDLLSATALQQQGLFDAFAQEQSNQRSGLRGLFDLGTAALPFIL